MLLIMNEKTIDFIIDKKVASYDQTLKVPTNEEAFLLYSQYTGRIRLRVSFNGSKISKPKKHLLAIASPCNLLQII